MRRRGYVVVLSSVLSVAVVTDSASCGEITPAL